VKSTLNHRRRHWELKRWHMYSKVGRFTNTASTVPIPVETKVKLCPYLRVVVTYVYEHTTSNSPLVTCCKFGLLSPQMVDYLTTGHGWIVVAIEEDCVVSSVVIFTSKPSLSLAESLRTLVVFAE
jgi:hypothetical protein